MSFHLICEVFRAKNWKFFEVGKIRNMIKKQIILPKKKRFHTSKRLLYQKWEGAKHAGVSRSSCLCKKLSREQLMGMEACSYSLLRQMVECYFLHLKRKTTC